MKIITILATTILSFTLFGQAVAEAKCKVTIVNKTPSKLILFTRHHQFTIHPNKQMSGKQTCEDLYRQGNPLGGTGYKMSVGFSPDKKSATFLVTGSTPMKCSGNMRCFNLVEPNRICIPCR